MLSTAESIGTVLERIRLEQSLTQKNQALSALNAISNTPVEENTLSILLGRLHGELQKAVGEDVGFAVALHDPEHGSIQIPYYVDAESAQVDSYPLSDDLLSRTISRNEVTIINEAVSLGLKTITAPGKVLTTKSFLGVPLLFEDKVIGAIALLDNQKPGRFNDTHVELLVSIAPQVGANVHVAQLLTEQYETIQSYDQELFLFNTLLEHTPDRVEFLNRDGRILRLSRAAADDPFVTTIDQTPGSVEGSNTELALMDTGEPVWGQMEKRTLEDGSEKWELVSRVPMTNSDNQIIGLMIFSRDMTDFKLTQMLAEHRANQLLTAAEIARGTSSGSQDISEMLKRLVELVRDRFGFYHSSIFLLDALGQNAVLRESTGEAGEALKKLGHKLAVGSQSIIGQTTLLGTAVIVNDVNSAENYYPNPLLPETRSEAGIPLINAGQVIGALDVQSERINAFTDEEVRILLVLADQLAVAIQNAELFTKTESSLLRHRLLHQITAMAGKSSSVDDAIRTAVETLHQVMSRDEITYWSPTTAGKLLVKAYAGLPTLELASTVLSVGERTVGAAASEKRTIRLSEISEGSLYQPIDPDCHSVVCVPVTYQDRLLGVLNVENTEVAAFDETDQEIITTLADNLASIISNIQLVDQVKLQVDRQQQLYDITSKIRRSADIETIMQTSIAEICNAMGIRRASIEITAGDGKSETASSAYQDQTSMDGGVK
jgi:GAF domain-containing protein